ncbi:hypothetical protein QRD02_10510 [Aequorivita sp. SDUM287046]|uniref:Uncharacterized protein n=1 Tax=Aequorivita aurantiaca TaxID=3053356 RepID=A0ABT8DHD4_9FLAO|nr:hypothetical protein [Aequorivita aurantiaca]MDN3724816.1 hypothetical protein [Aequorivita aurantiaca]
MKTVVISLTLSLTVAVLSAQEVTVLDETRLYYAPLNSTVSQEGDSYVYKIKESENRQFAKDPIGFMNANFDIKNFINSTDKKYHSYLVTFVSEHGTLEADFDRDGDLVETRQQFKNVVLPAYIRNDVYSTYQGWTLVKTKYNARTKGNTVANGTYKIQLEKDKERQNLKIAARSTDVGVAFE